MELKKVYYRHYRYHEYAEKIDTPIRYYRSGNRKSCWIPSCKGGMTECVGVVNYGGNEFEIVAKTVCRPDEHFVYKTGKEISHARFLHLWGRLKAIENMTE